MSEEFVIAIIEGLTPFAGIALDIGANQGDYTEVLATKFEHVYAFEPFPSNIKKLKKRFADNSKVTIVPKAVSHKIGKQKLYINGIDSEPSLSIMFAQSRSWNYNEDKFIEVETITLDEFCKDKNVAFMKVDVEGAEQFLFRGALETLQNKSAWILLETHLIVDYELLTELFQHFGYQFITHNEKGFVNATHLYPGTHFLIHKGDVKLTDKMEEK